MGPCFSTHLIDENGTFNVGGIEHFAKEVKLAECGLSYAVVAIMGPKSSGKSTLLNLLFLTDFKEMDAQQGRSKTTKGVWLARSGIIMTPCTLVMDLEGTDGKDRGEDNSAFEKQIALFALAVSDILLINMWCHDIGREQAANRPLLKTIFQQVMTRLFSPRKTTLMFVIRDKTRTPLVELERVLREDIQKIWNSVPKPQAHKDTPLSEFFNVEVVALSSYKEDREQFYEELASLRLRFFNSTEAGGLAGDRSGVVHGTAFPSSAQQIWKVIKEDKDPIWKVIKEDKDPHLPDLKVTVAIRCEAIAVEMSDRFKEAFDKALKTGKGFAAAARDSTDYFMSQFDAASADVQVTQANWDSSEVREKLRRDIDAHIAAVRIAKLAELTTMYEKNLSEALGGPTEALLDAARDDIMAAIRAIFRHETGTAISRFSGALRSFEIDDSTENTMITRLKDYSRGVVEAKVKEEAQRVFDRFSASVLRVCTGNEDIQAIIETARSASLRLLSVVAAIRLDDDDADSIENTLSLALIEAGSSNSLDSSSWDEVPLSKTLLTPVECKSLWRKFESGMDLIVTQAIARRKQAGTADIIGTIAKVVAAGAIIAYAAYLAATSSSTTR